MLVVCGTWIDGILDGNTVGLNLLLTSINGKQQLSWKDTALHF